MLKWANDLLFTKHTGDYAADTKIQISRNHVSLVEEPPDSQWTWESPFPSLYFRILTQAANLFKVDLGLRTALLGTESDK